jgi:hypothetical protein
MPPAIPFFRFRRAKSWIKENIKSTLKKAKELISGNPSPPANNGELLSDYVSFHTPTPTLRDPGTSSDSANELTHIRRDEAAEEPELLYPSPSQSSDSTNRQAPEAQKSSGIKNPTNVNKTPKC